MRSSVLGRRPGAEAMFGEESCDRVGRDPRLGVRLPNPDQQRRRVRPVERLDQALTAPLICRRAGRRSPKVSGSAIAMDSVERRARVEGLAQRIEMFVERRQVEAERQEARVERRRLETSAGSPSAGSGRRVADPRRTGNESRPRPWRARARRALHERRGRRPGRILDRAHGGRGETRGSILRARRSGSR